MYENTNLGGYSGTKPPAEIVKIKTAIAERTKSLIEVSGTISFRTLANTSRNTPFTSTERSDSAITQLEATSIPESTDIRSEVTARKMQIAIPYRNSIAGRLIANTAAQHISNGTTRYVRATTKATYEPDVVVAHAIVTSIRVRKTPNALTFLIESRFNCTLFRLTLFVTGAAIDQPNVRLA